MLNICQYLGCHWLWILNSSTEDNICATVVHSAPSMLPKIKSKSNFMAIFHLSEKPQDVPCSRF